MLPPNFWAKTRPTDCIIWTGAVNTKGYGCYAVNGVSQLAHRVAWEDVHGPIPDGMTVDHLCRVRSCVNTMHMEIVSIAENVRRARRRLVVGGTCRNGHQITTPADLYRRGNGAVECRACRQAQTASRSAA